MLHKDFSLVAWSFGQVMMLKLWDLSDVDIKCGAER